MIIKLFVKKMFQYINLCVMCFDMYNMCSCMCLCVHLCVKSEDNLECLSLSSTLFETGSLETLCTLAIWPQASRHFPVPTFHLTTSIGITEECYHVQLYMHRESNSGPHACCGKRFATSPSNILIFIIT